MKIYINFLFILFFLITFVQSSAQENPVLYNSGVISIVHSSSDPVALFVEGNVSVSCEAGGIKSEFILESSKLVLTGDFIHNAFEGAVFRETTEDDDFGVVEFRGDTLQMIKTTGLSYEDIPSKETNYIHFPNLLINNSNHVKVTPEIAVMTHDVELEKGWLILDSRITDSEKDYAPEEYNEVTASNESVSAYLHVNGKINYKNWEDIEPENRGFIQVNMAFENEGKNTDPQINEGRPVTSMIGFGSPFEEIRADYFLFNILYNPSPDGIGEPNRYVDNILKAGRGHIFSIDTKGYDYAEYDDPASNFNEANFDKRAKDGFYYFNRHHFSVDPDRSLNQVYGSFPNNDAYLKEKLNNPEEYIEIPLKKGYNYLSNPFLTPLDISELIYDSNTNDWNVIINANENSERDIYPAVWLLNPDSRIEYKGNQKATLFYNYRIIQNPGGTEDKELVAPLQMFIVWAARECSIRIPKSVRVMKEAKFIRSNSDKSRYDDFIIEIQDEHTRTSDRINLVLRPEAEINTYYSHRNIQKEISENLLLGSQLFSKNKSNEKLNIHFLPIENTDCTQLYTYPSYLNQEITIRGIRINSLRNAEGIWLEDKKEKIIVELTESTRYKTSSNTRDRADRFIIHFKRPDSLTEINEEILAFYKDGKIIISGFGKEYYDKKVLLYDINGRLLKKNIIDQYSIEMQYGLSAGVYIIRIEGEKSHSIKLIAY